MSITSEIKPSQYNIYADYHDLSVKVLFDKEGKRLYTKKIQFKEISFYIFGGDDIPDGLSYKIMKFSEFYNYVVESGYKYLSYYYNRAYFWHIDAYKAFTKEHLEHYFETTKTSIRYSQYSFLLNDWIESTNGMKFKLDLKEKTCLLIDFDEDVKNLIIPDMYMNYPVVEICSKDRKYLNFSLESVFVPKTIKRISSGAFRCRDSLEEIRFEEGSELEYIGPRAFEQSSIKEISIPKSVKIIKDYAFLGCLKLESVVFAEGSELTNLGNSVFAYCPLLKSLELPKSVETITESFTDSEISSITIPMIKKRFCNNLTFSGGFLQEGFYEERSKLERIIVSDGSVGITASAFNDCSSVKEIVLPSSILFIGENAFPPSLYWNIKIIYKGTVEQWRKIKKHDNWMNTNSHNSNLRVKQIICVDGIYKV